jgi:hypothetical protein
VFFKVNDAVPRRSTLALDVSVLDVVPQQMKLPTLESRARIATLVLRGFGCGLVLMGALILVVGLLASADRAVPIVGAIVALALGLAFFVAKPITAEHLRSRFLDL